MLFRKLSKTYYKTFPWIVIGFIFTIGRFMSHPASLTGSVTSLAYIQHYKNTIYICTITIWKSNLSLLESYVTNQSLLLASAVQFGSLGGQHSWDLAILICFERPHLSDIKPIHMNFSFHCITGIQYPYVFHLYNASCIVLMTIKCPNLLCYCPTDTISAPVEALRNFSFPNVL